MARVTVTMDPERALLGMWRAAVTAAQPKHCLGDHWPDPPEGRLALLACGKAALPMAAEAVRRYGTSLEGVVIYPGDPAAAPQSPAPGLRLYPANHPVPDHRSVDAARAALKLASGLTGEGLLLVLLSGGGSSLMCLPTRGVSLEEKQALTRNLLACGASIGEINCVRKHLSRIKGGRLAQSCAAPVVTLAISDVPGDDPGAIASGPTVADPTTPADARAVLARHAFELPAAVDSALQDRDPAATTTNRDWTRDRFRIVASGMTALRAAERWCRDRGVQPHLLGDGLEGDATELARQQARQALELAATRRPACLLSGGETTVRLGAAPGKGGRNTEFALALALELEGHSDVWALAADTDGIDGYGGHSGALVGPETLARARKEGLDPDDYLQRHDSATFFRRVGGLLQEGPTGTNVNDFRAILVKPSGR
jgi:hydroxypyruvate reductase